MPASYVVSYALLAALSVSVLALVYEVAAGAGHRPVPAHPVRSGFRRCSTCNVRWLADEGAHYTRRALLLRRAVRRARRRLHVGHSPLPPSWDRCPSCLSRRVRTSRVQE